tara:strand:+ start:1086 stop:1865 length:780 start_codon:yes stop_codon:yes gene_type:complete
MVSGQKRKVLNTRDPGPAFKVRIRESFYKDISVSTVKRIQKYIKDEKTNTISIFFNQDKIDNIQGLKNIMDKMNINNQTHPSDKIAMIIGVFNYSKDSKEISNIHKNHCIAAYKINDTLYCLDPWGKDKKSVSMKIFYKIQRITNCKHLFIYNGKNLQKFDKTGVCVGLSANFLMNMGVRKQKLGYQESNLPVKKKKYDELRKRSPHEKNAKTLYTKIRRIARERFFDRYMYFLLSQQSLKEIETNLRSKNVQKIKIEK